MKAWFKDIPDQLGLAMLLSRSGISCGERIALIAVDNAVEYMLIAYVEAHRRLLGKTISKKDWTENKKHFEKLLDFVISQCPGMVNCRTDILGFHDLRNSLYHTGQPLSVKQQQVDNYLRLAREAFELLFGTKLTDNNIEECAARITSCLLKQERPGLRVPASFEQVDGHVRLISSLELDNPDAICLLLHGYAIKTGCPPSFQDLLQCLHLSGFTLKDAVLSVRLSELRRKGMVQRDQLALSAKGRAQISRRFLTLP
jgi:hypothetical protein